MLDEHEFALETGMLLVLRYRILDIERYWSPDILPDPNGDTPPRDIGGAIYRAQDLVVEDAVQMVHVLERLAYSEDPTMRQTTLQRLEIEANSLAAMNHVVIPTVQDYFMSSDRAYLVTDYQQGIPLKSVIQSPTYADVSIKTIIGWLTELCDAIAYMHERNPPVLFRVLGAEKVVIDAAGHVYLTDLSGVSVYEPGIHSASIGVDGYAAPEQYSGEHVPQSDIYCIGALLHYLLTGRDPSHAKRFSFVDRPVRQLNPKVSKALDMIVYKALAFDPRFRFGTVREMQEALSAL